MTPPVLNVLSCKLVKGRTDIPQIVIGHYFDKNYLVSAQTLKLKKPISPLFYSKERKEFR